MRISDWSSDVCSSDFNKRVLIDTGTGGALAPTTGKLLDHLRAAGYEPAQIDEILITHLHPDHVGGVTHDGKAVFPNAVLRVSAADVGYWADDAKRTEERRGGDGCVSKCRPRWLPYT